MEKETLKIKTAVMDGEPFRRLEDMRVLLRLVVIPDDSHLVYLGVQDWMYRAIVTATTQHGIEWYTFVMGEKANGTIRWDQIKLEPTVEVF